MESQRPKSILTPTKRVEFLGAIWYRGEVTRTEAATKALKQTLAYVYNETYPLESKFHQKLRGFLNYYLGFAGTMHVVINHILKMSLALGGYISSTYWQCSQLTRSDSDQNQRSETNPQPSTYSPTQQMTK